MIVDQELTGLEFVGVHAPQEHSVLLGVGEVFAVELGGHIAPDFSARGQKTLSVTTTTGTSTSECLTWTVAMWPFAAKSIQLAS